MNEKTRELILKRILPLAVIALYVIGMVLMIFGNFGNGVTLWVISTAGGALLLYVKRRHEKIAADEAQAEEEERAYQENLRKQNEQETK